MKKLKLYPVTRIDELAWPEQPEQISLQTPALAFFTDFKKIQPLVIEASATAVETRKMMLNMHVRLNFVLDDNDHLVGVITADDLAERKIVQQVAAGADREEITVSDLMTPDREGTHTFQLTIYTTLP